MKIKNEELKINWFLESAKVSSSLNHKNKKRLYSNTTFQLLIFN